MKLILFLFCILFYLDFYAADDAAMFPFGPAAGDEMIQERADRNNAHSLTIPQEGIVFLGRRHTNLKISNHGALYFTAGKAVYHINTPALELESPPFAAPLYYDAEWESDPLGKVYHRSLNRDSTSPSLLDLSRLMNEGVIGSSSFDASYAVIVTWVNTTDSVGVHCADPHSMACKNINRNTFQAVLVWDQLNTFVIFNYAQVTETKSAAMAGIYGGDFVRWTSVRQDETRKLHDLEVIHGVNDVMGRFLFKVSGDKVIRGGCNTGLASGSLMLSPTSAGMYGGEIIEVSGPCFNPSDSIHCQFGDTTVVGQRTNYYKAFCTVPMLKQRGKIPVRLSASNPPRFNYASQDFTVLSPGRVTAGVRTDYLGSGKGWNESNPSSLTLNWESQKLSEDYNARVDVILHGYREDETQAYWTELLTIASAVENSQGRPSGFTFSPEDFRCSGDQCTQYEVGVIEVKLTSGQTKTHSSLFSYNQPLGWFVHEAMTEMHGEQWHSVLCEKWHDEDSKDTSWIEELPNCPCTMTQALADFGRWQPDVGCNIFTGSKCTFHQGAVHCVRSVQPTAQGAGNQCCYSADGNLKYAADSFQGSTPDRGHAWGAAPYVKPGYVPDESHWVYDVVSFYYCCLWVDYKDCDKYMNRRPTRDCVNYQPSGAAIAFGDPHINTFDGVMYRFQGDKREYTLVEAGLFRLQGRFTHKRLQYSNFNVSILTTIAVEDDSDVVEIRLAAADDKDNRELDVIVNGEYQSFVSSELHWQDYSGVSVVTEKGNIKQNNVTILFHSGIGVQVAANSGLLNVIVSLPPQMKTGQTRGLFGVWDSDETNDLMPRGETVPTSTASSPEEIFNSFASTWSVSTTDRLFLFKEPKNPATNFNPSFVDASGLPDPRDLMSICGDNAECRYDYKLTGNRTLAEATLSASLWYQSLREFLLPVETCGLLDVPYAEKDNTVYRSGSSVTITGCRLGYNQEGETTYTCDPSSLEWTPPVSSKCVDPAQVDDAGLGMKIGIGLGAVGGVALIVIIIIVSVKLSRRKSASSKRSQNAGTELKPEPRVPSRSEYLPAKTTEDIEDQRPKTAPRRARVEGEERV